MRVLLPEPDAPVIGSEHAERERDIYVFEIVLARSAHGECFAVAAAATRRRLDLPLSREKLPGGRGLAGEDSVDGSLRHYFAAMDSGAGAHFDDVVGGANGVLVVLHNNYRVADIAQALKRRNHLHVVFGMQPDTGLVEHVEHPHETRADLRGEADALRFAARERGRAAIETEVVEPDSQ